MNIIIVSNKLAKTRSVSLNGIHLLTAAAILLVLFIMAVLSAEYAIVRFQPGRISNEMRAWLASAQNHEQQKQQAYLRESLDTMAISLGQMQARLLRLDSLGTRLVKVAGMKPQEIDFSKVPAQGGAYVPAGQQEITLASMNQQLGNLSALLTDRGDKLAALETLLQQDRLRKKMLSTIAPVSSGWYSSNFGWRVDPFTGRSAMHEGVDYVVPQGTPIHAAASGIVVYAALHPQFGNLVEIDHGSDILTRYAHASKLLVEVGQVVKRGQLISLVGSTGRSTGNHLHFEVRFKGLAQNPVRFLQSNAS
ncbi:MAG: peptidase M23 [Gallionellales bacterium 35-53-114]|jgi:murein DD-endopeptidase MepM/ murein hydrolase activator NlpD|nr:MAG: peptidase M23 [Gallionellales bacterium 35-53-114]OYZ63903.1 MAG: peptidase M23 [Gallionellales bacterium 24-53-125]OZB09266.1 MAG: peptidase M23 [Gallionellales bacterium 39-52-133]HQS59127.1 M23 family metallopeptidase [Gallionellaceae bacterium]HQS75863.1 M23 family metallopeptidase [Gallionellaceae bacterium]